MGFGDVLLNSFFGLIAGIVIVFLVEYFTKDNNDDDTPDIDDFRIYE